MEQIPLEPEMLSLVEAGVEQTKPTPEEHTLDEGFILMALASSTVRTTKA